MIDYDKIKKTYYYTDIEPTLERLETILLISENFEKEGASRLACALNMKRMDIDEVEKLSSYIAEAREKMGKELKRVEKLEKNFNQEFATDHNEYFNSVSEILGKIRSHLSPLKSIFRKFCYRKQLSLSEREHFQIASQSVIDKSVLALGEYQPDIFDISEYPTEVQSLFSELKSFFDAEAECMRKCKDILEEEMRIRRDPVQSKYVLDKSRRKAFKKLKSTIMLISDDAIENLKAICPAYEKYREYASDEGFAQAEFHKHNTADMDHLYLIEMRTKNTDLTIEEKALWGDNPSVVKKIKYIILHFDELLPEEFQHKMMGFYEYVFCKWALPNNIKCATEYLIKHYKGKYKTSKYAAVNRHGKEYDHHSNEVKNFNKRINELLLQSGEQELIAQVV